MTTSAQPTAYDFSFEALQGGALSLSTWRGKPLLVVNTASECGFTKQYKQLQALWQDYRARGLIVLGVPCNDFGGQEPGDAAAIDQFCVVNFGIDFPMTAKCHIYGKNAHPFYQWANAWAGLIGSPKWNFHKYLIGPEGQMVDWYAPTTDPCADKITRAIISMFPP